jgi:hypothetical protein
MLILEIPGKLRKGIHIKDQLYPIDHHNYALQPSPYAGGGDRLEANHTVGEVS